MFDGLTLEIFCYSIIPVAIIALVILFILLFVHKKANDEYKKSYIINTLLIIMISFVLPLITGYTIWYIVRYLGKGTLLSHIGYVIILMVLIIALIVLLYIISRKLYRKFSGEKRVSN